MKVLDLRLRWSEIPMREATAFFLAGTDTDEWLREIEGWRGNHSELRLYPVPHGINERSLAGLLAVFPRAVSGIRGLPLGRRGTGLYLPTESDLFPAISDDELAKLFPFHLTFFHPSLGLSGYEEADKLTVDALFQRPALPDSNWGHAEPFQDMNRRLVSIRFDAPESFGELFKQEAKEIGSDPVKPPKSIFGKTKKPKMETSGREPQGRGGMGSMIPGMLGGFGEWAMRRIESLRQSMESNRNRELTNLLEDLNKNPDLALRRAIPLSAHSPHRGIAPPSDRLGDRRVDFNLGRVGSGAADFWNIPSYLEAQLRARYIALANREVQLHNYRRAAYIFAELLGDLHAAANVLKQGKHYREAGLLLRDHLHNKLAAAQCFEEGGMLPEAIALYEELGQHRDLGRVYRKMGDEAAAVAALREAVRELTNGGNRILAARILDTDLSARDEALALLDESWPHSSQMVAALEVYFEICRRDSLEDAIRNRVQRFRKEPIPPAVFFSTIKLLANVADIWKGTNIRRTTSDLCRVLIGKALAKSSPSEMRALTEVVTLLNRQDPQLRRDAARFTEHAKEKISVKTEITSRAGSLTDKPVRITAEFQLPPDVTWKRVVASGACFYAVGELDKKTLALRGLWNGHLQQVTWPRPELPSQDYLLDVDPSHPYQVLLCGFAYPASTPNRLLPADDQFSQRFCEIGTPPWLSQKVPLAIASRGGKIAMLSLDSSSEPKLAIYNRMGDMISARRIPVPLGASKPAMCMLGNAVVGGFDETLWIATEKEVITENVGALILSLTASREHTRPAYVMATSESVEMRWLGSSQSNLLADDFSAPHVAFLRDGRVVLLERGDGRIYEVNAAGIAGATRFQWPHRDPVALCHAGERAKIAVFDSSGRVWVLLV